MPKRTISTPEGALALANVVNPGGQRMLDDGSFLPGIRVNSETNCTMVAFAAAAFLQDGTEVAAFDAPSPLATQGNSKHFTKEALSLDSVPYNENIEIDFNKSREEVLDAIKEVRSRFPGQQIIAIGTMSSGYHAFNITAEGVALDVQLGASGEELFFGQFSHEGLKPYEVLNLCPVDTRLTGQEIIAIAEGFHQFASLSSLANAFWDKYNLDLFQLKALFEEVNDLLHEFVRSPIDTLPTIQQEEMPRTMNAVFDYVVKELNRQGFDGEKELQDLLKDLVTPRHDLRFDEDRSQSWLAEAGYREPSSTNHGPRVVDIYRDLCPQIDKAMRSIELRGPTDLDR